MRVAFPTSVLPITLIVLIGFAGRWLVLDTIDRYKTNLQLRIEMKIGRKSSRGADSVIRKEKITED